jgi:hypothetical protein
VALPKLTAPTGADLAAKFKPSPPAQALVKPGQSSSDYVHALEQNKMPLDAVHGLAHGMPERESVWWACQSSRKVGGKLNPQELSATSAAENWVKNPTPVNKALAAHAASKTDFKGPGGWAAQAAAWSKGPSPAAAAPAKAAVPGAPAATAPALTPAAVAGSVVLAAGLVKRPAMAPPSKPQLGPPKLGQPKLGLPTLPTAPKLAAPKPSAPTLTPPSAPAAPAVDQAKLAGPLHPFLALGKDVASGKNTWA